MYGRCWEYTNLMLNSSHRGTISGVKQPKLTPKANLSPEVVDPRFSLDTQGYRSGECATQDTLAQLNSEPIEALVPVVVVETVSRGEIEFAQVSKPTRQWINYPAALNLYHHTCIEPFLVPSLQRGETWQPVVHTLYYRLDRHLCQKWA
eukprot:Em0004g248a